MGCSYNHTPYRSFAEFFGSFPPVVLRAMISNNIGACLPDLLCTWYKASIANVCTFTSGMLPRPSLPCVCSSMTLNDIYCHLLTNWQVLLCRARLPSRLYSGNGLPGVFRVWLASCSACRITPTCRLFLCRLRLHLPPALQIVLRQTLPRCLQTYPAPGNN